MTSPFRLNDWVQKAVPDTKCICCKIEYYEFKYSCTKISQGFSEEQTLVTGLIEIGALQGGKTLLRQKRDYCRYGGPPLDYSIVDAKTLREQQRALLEENMSSDEARSSGSATQSSSETYSSYEKSESSDNTREKRLQEIYKELAESAAAFEREPNKDFEQTLAVRNDDNSDTVSINTEMIVEDLYEYFDSEIYCLDNSPQDLSGYQGDYSELLAVPFEMPEISSEEVSEVLASIENSIVDSKTLERDLAVSSTTTESLIQKLKPETDVEFPQPGTSSTSGYENGN